MEIDLSMSVENWREQSKYEAKINFDLRYQHGGGPCSIFILDTSASLGVEGFEQMKAAFTAIVDEYARHFETDENVAVIVCGQNTRFQRHFSNLYEDIKHCIDDVTFGGPSPLTAAFFLAESFLDNNQSSHSSIMGDFHILPRVILITDGRPTDFTCTSGNSCDDCPSIETENDRDHFLQLTRMIGRRNPIFCIPVGRNPDTMTLEFISAQSRGGKVVYPQDAKQLARHSQHVEIASKLSFTPMNDGDDRERILMSLATTFPHRDFTESDQVDIIEICTKKHLYRPTDLKELVEEFRNQNERDPSMLPVGSRVRRGRDWKWREQDNFCPGTVIDHLKPGWLVVKWDIGSTYNYRYGSSSEDKDKYDVEMCDEPRTLTNELIAVGCLVKRGPDWKWGDQDGGPGNIGSVFQIQRNGLVNVYAGEFSPTSHHETESKVKSDIRQHTKPMLQVKKGKYFKNNSVVEQSPSDIETDGQSVTLAVDQWFWKDEEEKWIPYSRETNERINKCYRRNPKSTVVVTIQDQSVVLAKHTQINLTTRDIFDVKLVSDGNS